MLQALLLAVDREVRRIKSESPHCAPYLSPREAGPANTSIDFLFQNASGFLQPREAISCAVAARNTANSGFGLQGFGLPNQQPVLRLDQVPQAVSSQTVNNDASYYAMPSSQLSDSGSDETRSSDSASDKLSLGSSGSSPKVCRPKACRPAPTGQLPLPFHALVLPRKANIVQPQKTVKQPALHRSPTPEDSAQPPKKRCKTDDSPKASSCSSGGTSGFRGVSWHSQTCKWKAQIKVNGRDINLGRHKDEGEAAKAYDRAAICARGVESARLNFPIAHYTDEIEYLTSTPLQELASVLRGVEERLQQQTSRYHGVRLNKRTNKWEAYIRISGKHVHLGCYDSESCAAKAFDQAAIVRHTLRLGAASIKTPVVTNFPQESYLELQHRLLKAGLASMNVTRAGATLAAAEAACLVYQLPSKYMVNLLQRCMEDDASP